jgi:broad specificity phosphatase PhoE
MFNINAADGSIDVSPGTSTSPVYTVILMRHGESVGNAEGLHQGQSDFPLTENGRAQSRALAQRWKATNRRFNGIITSPLERALQTAEIIGNVLETPIEPEALWMERDNGLLAGLRPKEAVQVSPRPAFIHPYQPVGETGESQWDLYLRGAQAVSKLIAHPPGSYLVVSHGGILNLAMYAILGIPLQANFTGPRFRFDNTAFATLTYRPNEHKWTVYGMNDRSHWKPPRS